MDQETSELTKGCVSDLIDVPEVELLLGVIRKTEEPLGGEFLFQDPPPEVGIPFPLLLSKGEGSLCVGLLEGDPVLLTDSSEVFLEGLELIPFQWGVGRS